MSDADLIFCSECGFEVHSDRCRWGYVTSDDGRHICYRCVGVPENAKRTLVAGTENKWAWCIDALVGGKERHSIVRRSVRIIIKEGVARYAAVELTRLLNAYTESIDNV